MLNYTLKEKEEINVEEFVQNNILDSELKEIFDWIDENCVIKMVAA